MYPGLVGVGDTPKLQFVGAVLGIPHSPGYPLYVVLSWIFAKIPIGTIAYRINLLSAISSALAASLLTLTLVELGCLPIVAFAGALAVAFGSLFWSQAILAEVYGLNAAMFAGVLYCLARWARTREPVDLIAAIALYGLGLAHHYTLAMTGPALLLYALAVDRHVITRRTVLVAIVACAIGLACYALVWLRTSEGAPFLEARAQSFSDLVAVVSGRRFHRALFAFSPAELVETRAPLVARWMVAELRWSGLLLGGVAVVALWRRRRAAVGLVLGCAALVTFFALNYNVFDVQVFLLIPMMALGLLAALGLDVAARWMITAGAPAMAVAVLALLLPYSQYRANVHQNNQRRHSFEMQYFDALFAALPDRSAIVAESYPIDNMVLYKLIGEGLGRGRQIVLIEAEVPTVRRHLENGYHVFAFANSRSTLEFDGVPFVPIDLGLPSPTSGRHLADSEVPQLTYGLAMAVGPADRALGSASEDLPPPPEPFTGALWRPRSR